MVMTYEESEYGSDSADDEENEVKKLKFKSRKYKPEGLDCPSYQFEKINKERELQTIDEDIKN